MTRVVDTGVHPRTTNEPSIDSPLPLAKSPGPNGSGIGGSGELQFTKNLNPAMREAIESRLTGIPTKIAQEVLDELEGRMAIAEVRNPVRYCAVLLARQQRSAFTPELGLAIAARRERSAHYDAALQQTIAAARKTNQGVALPDHLKRSIDRIRGRKPRESR